MGKQRRGFGLVYMRYAKRKKSRRFPSDVESEYESSQNRLVSTFYFELHRTNPQSTSVTHIPDLHLHKENNLSLMKLLIEQYNMPPEHRFLLLTRIRYAHAFRASRICMLYSKICLLAIIVLV